MCGHEAQTADWCLMNTMYMLRLVVSCGRTVQFLSSIPFKFFATFSTKLIQQELIRKGKRVVTAASYMVMFFQVVRRRSHLSNCECLLRRQHQQGIETIRPLLRSNAPCAK